MYTNIGAKQPREGPDCTTITFPDELPKSNALQIKLGTCHKIIHPNKYFNFTTAILLLTLFYWVREMEVDDEEDAEMDLEKGCPPVVRTKTRGFTFVGRSGATAIESN